MRIRAEHVIATLCLLLFMTCLALAQTPVLPGYQICSTASGSTQCSFQPVDGTHGLPVTASVTVTGFAGNGSYATLTATTSTSASTALPTGTTVNITNTSTSATVSCTFATGAATGLVSNLIIPPQSSKSRVVGTYDHIACIDQTGSTGSNLVVIEGGSGLGNDSGGGGGSGSGSGTTDAASWTTAVSTFTPTGGVFNDSAAALTAGQQGTVRLNANREMHVTCDIGNVLCALLSSPQTIPGTLVSGATWVKGTTAAMTGTSSTQIIAAVTSNRIYAMRVSCKGDPANAVGTKVLIQDGSGGTTLDTLTVAASGGGEQATAAVPLFWTTAGNGLFAQNVTTSASVICTASGYSG